MTDTPSCPRSRRRVDGGVRADAVVTDGELARVVQSVHVALGPACAHDTVGSSRLGALALSSYDDSAKSP
jgi:hypothetical protein